MAEWHIKTSSQQNSLHSPWHCFLFTLTRSAGLWALHCHNSYIHSCGFAAVDLTYLLSREGDHAFEYQLFLKKECSVPLSVQILGGELNIEVWLYMFERMQEIWTDNQTNILLSWVNNALQSTLENSRLRVLSIPPTPFFGRKSSCVSKKAMSLSEVV